VWLLHWNGAIGWDEMKLVSGLIASDRALGKAGTGEMELGQEIAKCKVRNHSCRGVNPAYELNERTERPVPVSPRTGLGSEKASEANVPEDLGRRNFHLAIFRT